MEGREGRTRTNDDGPLFEGTLERFYAEREKERRRGLCLSEKHELKTMGTDSAKVDCSRGCIYIGRRLGGKKGCLFRLSRMVSVALSRGPPSLGSSRPLGGKARGRPRPCPRPARQRQVSAPVIRCINNALMYEADEGERQRGNGSQGRKTR